MAELCGIIADLDLCVGCYACEVACKQENDVPINTRWVRVVPVGPESVNGKLWIDFIPVMTDGCTFCEHRLKENLEPRCVANCPTEALRFYSNAAEIIKALQGGRRFQVCKLKGEVPAFA